MVSREPNKPARVALTHYAGLDGLRGLAVAAVLLYHGGVPWDRGGFLGVELFFVLSGFLITSLLLAEWSRSGTIALGEFWARRARRLLPALFCLIVAIGVYYAAAGSSQLVPGLKGDGFSALIYYSNWHQIAEGSNYFAASGPVSPLQHTWSLAIEEQFYLLWPILVAAVLWLAARRGSGSRGRPLTAPRGPGSEIRQLRVLLVLAVVGAIGSALDMALLFDGGHHLNRVYYGTDTRAASLLMGGSLAIALALLRTRRGSRGFLQPGTLGARLAGKSALPALAGIVVAVRVAGGSSAWLYPYGLLGVDALVLVVIVAAVCVPTSLAARILGVRPLRAVGKISYGLYLWHFPLFLWLDTDSTHLSGARLLLLRLGLTFLISTLSYFLIEQPIRQRRIPAWLVRGLGPVAAGGAVASLLAAAAASSLPIGIPAADVLPQLRGSDPPCKVKLTDGSQYGVAPIPPAKEQQFEYGALGEHQLTWSGSGEKTFQTCPPKRVLLVGDSLAFTLGVPMLSNEDWYGVEVEDAAILGCAFTTQGELDVNGTWEGQSAGCPDEVQRWAREERAFHPQAVVVELGYRDQFDWRINGKVVHLGQPGFDAYVRAQIERFVQVLGAGHTKILFLSVPYTDPPHLPDGSAAPAASPARRAAINSMLKAAARRHPGTVRVLDLDRTVSPGNHYNATVNGQLCRFDGVHFTVYCGELLEPSILGEVRKMTG